MIASGSIHLCESILLAAPGLGFKRRSRHQAYPNPCFSAENTPKKWGVSSLSLPCQAEANSSPWTTGGKLHHRMASSLVSTALPVHVERRLSGMGFFQIWLKEFKFWVFLILLLRRVIWEEHFFIILQRHIVSISYHVSFQRIVNNIPAILVLWLDIDFLESLNAFTMCVYCHRRAKYLTETSQHLIFTSVKP